MAVAITSLGVRLRALRSPWLWPQPQPWRVGRFSCYCEPPRKGLSSPIEQTLSRIQDAGVIACLRATRYSISSSSLQLFSLVF